jgi:hypothetical protein
METIHRPKRRRVLAQPRLQLRIVLAFLSAACISTLVQVLVLSYRLNSLAESLPADGNLVLEQLPGILRSQVLLTFLLMAPLMLAVGVLETFRVVGPLHRFERYLRDLAAGKRPEPCRIRKGDELQGLCRLLNEATQNPLVRPQAVEEAAAVSTPSVAVDPPSLVERPSSKHEI